MFTANQTVHRYLGKGICTDVKVTSVTEDGRAVLEDGSIINRFTKSYYHTVVECPIPRLKVIQGQGGIKVSFPTVVEERTYQSSKPEKRGPYTTQRLSSGSFSCNCPGNTYHPPCSHIKDWKEELSQSTD